MSARDRVRPETQPPLAPDRPRPADKVERLRRRLERERRTRREAEQIAKRITSSLYERQRELELLETVAGASNEATTIEDALRVAIDAVCAHTGWPIGHAYLARRPGGELVSTRIWRMADPQRFESFRAITEATTFAPGEGLAGRVIASGEPAWITDLLIDENFPRLLATGDIGVRCAFAFPILAGPEAVGVVEFYTDRTNESDAALLHLAKQLGTQLGRVVERVRGRAKITHQALHDGLTGLPNRTLLLDRLQVALARSSRAPRLTGVLFLDVDHFKLINDSFGHRTGDRVLIEVARRLSRSIRPGDTFARLGGDEFVVLCEDLDRDSDALLLAERIELQLLAPFELPHDDHHIVTASVGVAIAGAGTDAEALLRDTDAAMYRAKELGRARHELFDAAMRERVRERLQTERALTRALDGDELCLHYQPVFGLRGGQLEAMEALLRWNSPDRGLVGPRQLIPVAEQSGLILRIGTWVLHEACRQAALWRSELRDRAPLPVNVNLAARQLGQPELTEIVGRAVSETGARPCDLALEITESALIENAEVPAKTLSELRDLGVRVSLDDFGTGYSSLGYLRRFPVDALKIDRESIAGLGKHTGDTAIVAAIVAMGHALGIGVVAEGIETEEQAAEATRLGCDSGQGNLFAKPAPPGEIVALALGGGVWSRPAARGAQPC